MKRKIYAMVLGAGFLACGSSFAQTKNVGIGTTTPDASAVLDIQSSNKGLLIPRMSSDQMRTINSPAAGLMVYQTGEKAGFYFFNGKDWKPLTDATEDAKSVAFDPDNWGLNGNSISSTNFIGTTNAQPLKFKVQNFDAGLIDNSFTTRGLFLGLVAGRNNTGLRNVGLGFEALSLPAGNSGSDNIAIGVGVLKNNTTGFQNTAIGSGAMGSNTVGQRNFAIGAFALQFNTTGNFNLAIGSSAMQLNTSGGSNVSVGGSSLSKNTTGNQNVAIGLSSLLNNQTGNDNVSIGHNSGLNATGSGNVFIGKSAGELESAGSNKLYISNTNSANPLIKGDFSANNLQVNSRTTGYLAIGDFSTATSSSPGTGGLPLPANIGQANGYRLVVQDGILCEKVKVALRATGSSDWADYVFEPEYQSKMMSLEEIDEYIKTNKHLPNVPSTAEVQKEGLDFHQTSRMFMEKIEELTLYMIDMKKEINLLKTENDVLKAKK
jgi:trimeric autotransporter adhesin